MPDYDSYCAFCAALPADDPNRAYHDREYGFPVAGDDALFARLVLEMNQAGLSWSTILRKKDAFFRAYGGFDPETVAAYGEADVARLLSDASIIRNRRKIEAAIGNAKAVLAIRREYGSFRSWLEVHHPRPLESWLKLFKTRFTFVGGLIVHEFLMSTGYLPGAHVSGCPAGDRAISAGAAWAAPDRQR